MMCAKFVELCRSVERAIEPREGNGLESRELLRIALMKWNQTYPPEIFERIFEALPLLGLLLHNISGQ